MPVQIGTKASSYSDPTGLLSDCHRRIETFLNTLNVVAEFSGRQLAADESSALEAALRYFREAAPKHNADEEESLFPRLRSVARPEVRDVLAHLTRLEHEHRWAAPLHAEADRLGRKWLSEGRLSGQAAAAFRSAVTQLVAMYRSHIDFEDKVLFPLAARVLSTDDTTQIAREMEQRRR